MFGFDLDIIILCALRAAKAHKKSLFERQIPVIPLRNCESKNLGFKGETSDIKINIKIHYLSRDLLCSTVANQGAFEQRDLYSTYGFERSMDRTQFWKFLP